MFLRVLRSAVAVAASIALCAAANSAIAQVAGEVRGRITDATTARPVVNARVEVGNRSEASRTGSDGSYTIRGLEPGIYSITARALGYAYFTQEIEVRNGRTTALDASLLPRVALLNDVHVRATRDTAALNTTVLDRSAIENSGRRDLGELLQTLPGVLVTQAGGSGQASQVSIRGSSANQVLVLIDGVPFNSIISGGADLSRVSLETISQVTVQTGAASARYGPRAMAGVIDIQTLRPQHEASTFLRTGSLGERHAATAFGNATTVRLANVGAFASADYRTVDGNFSYDLPALRGGGRASRINSDATSRQASAGVSVEGLFGSATVRGAWENADRGLAGTIIQPSSSGRQGSSRLSIAGSAQGILRRVAWTIATDVSHEEGTFIDRSPPFGEAFDDTISATGVTSSVSATVGQNPANASVGAELRTIDITSTMLAPNAPHWQQLLGAWGNTRFSRQVTASARIDAELSGRLDRNSLNDKAVISPRGIVRVSAGVLSTSVSLGSGYAPPTLADQFFHEGVQVRANPGLRAERTRQDLEGRATLRESQISVLTVSGEAAAYRSNIDGMILWFPDFQFVWSPTNFDVKRSGWELNGKIGLTRAHVEVSGALNRTDVTYTGEILRGQVAYRPRNTANINLAFAPKRLRIDFTNRNVGTRRTIAGSALNSLSPYSMSDIRASTSFRSRRWTFVPSAGVENIFNESAAMLVDYPFPPRTWNISLRVRRSTSQSS